MKHRLMERARGAERGQTVLELMMLTGFLVALAVFTNALIAPVIIEAFNNIAEAVSVIGP